jgi:protein tyrosine phosphatase
LTEQLGLFSMSYQNKQSYNRVRQNNQPCNHLYQPAGLVNARVFCSSWRLASRFERPIPDFALYADSVWVTKSRNEFINWPDFGAPKFPTLAIAQISSAYSLAETYEVEIGCIGGHGRTGTILACMAILDQGLNPQEAIDFTRINYCHHAIETDSQEAYVKFFWENMNGI